MALKNSVRHGRRNEEGGRRGQSVSQPLGPHSSTNAKDHHGKTVFRKWQYRCRPSPSPSPSQLLSPLYERASEPETDH